MTAYSQKITLITGNANPELGRAISRELEIPLATASLRRFPDGEIDIKVDDDLRGTDCFVIQPTCPPVNENWVELLLLLDCLRRSSAGRITAVMPYFGYARKDRKDEGRVPISAKVVANTLVGTGADRVLALDLHAAQIQGFFDIPVDHLYAKPVLLEVVRGLQVDKPVVVSPDVGGIKMARAYAKALDGADLAIVDKRRISGSQIAVEHVIGDVEGRNVIIVDDMISTGGSMAEAAGILRRHGARRIVVAVTHPVFCGPAIERLDAAPIDTLLVTDSIPLGERRPKNVRIVSIAPLLSQAIRNIHQNQSVSSLFD
ncbi:MAG: ribose-phosphate diphosphokinase [Planctomycetota bacterium]